MTDNEPAPEGISINDPALEAMIHELSGQMGLDVEDTISVAVRDLLTQLGVDPDTAYRPPKDKA